MLGIICFVGSVIGLILIILGGITSKTVYWSISAGVWTLVVGLSFYLALEVDQFWLVTTVCGFINIMLSLFNRTFATDY